MLVIGWMFSKGVKQKKEASAAECSGSDLLVQQNCRQEQNRAGPSMSPPTLNTAPKKQSSLKYKLSSYILKEASQARVPKKEKNFKIKPNKTEKMSKLSNLYGLGIRVSMLACS